MSTLRDMSQDISTAKLLSVLLDHLEATGPCFVLTHTNPDPDALAAALGIQAVLRMHLGGAVPIAVAGIIGRAENKALVRHLNLPLIPVSAIDAEMTPACVLVDSQPNTGNVPPLPEGAAVQAVLDHHPLREATRDLPFFDVRVEYGSTSTIAWEYVQAAGIEPNRQLATALFYGIKSDTHDLWRQVTEADEQAYLELFTRVDREVLTRIENPTVPRAYFQLLQQALARARFQGGALVIGLDQVDYPDFVAEIADFLLAVEDVEWSLATAATEGALVFSIRARDRTDEDADAGILAQELAMPFGGSAGGHGTMAAGRIPASYVDGQLEKVRARIHAHFLELLGAVGEESSLI